MSLSDAVKFVKGTNYDAKKNRFTDKFDEANFNTIKPTLEKSTTVFSAA